MVIKFITRYVRCMLKGNRKKKFREGKFVKSYSSLSKMGSTLKGNNLGANCFVF